MAKNFPCIFRQTVHHLHRPLYRSERYAQLASSILGKRSQRRRHFATDVVSNRPVHPRCQNLTNFRLRVKGFVNILPALQQFSVLGQRQFGAHNIFVNFGQPRLLGVKGTDVTLDLRPPQQFCRFQTVQTSDEGMFLVNGNGAEQTNPGNAPSQFVDPIQIDRTPPRICSDFTDCTLYNSVLLISVFAIKSHSQERRPAPQPPCSAGIPGAACRRGWGRWDSNPTARPAFPPARSW